MDAFVERAVQSLSSAGPTLRPEDIRAVRFTPVRLRSGYDMREVDEFLDAVEQTLAARQPEPEQAAAAEPATSAAPAGTRTTVQAWATRVKWVVLLVAVVAWVCATVVSGR